MTQTLIGVIGGMGSSASVLFEQMIQEQATSRCIQQPDLVHIAMSRRVPDRTEFLLGFADENPADFASEVALGVQTLSRAYYKRMVICVPCNTFHAPQIWNTYQKRVHSSAVMPVLLLNAASVLRSKLMSLYQQRQQVGVMCTDGSRLSRIFDRVLSPEHCVIHLSSEKQKQLMDVIYSPAFGLKHQVPPRSETFSNLQQCIDELRAAGATVIVFGCSELSLIREQMECGNTVVLDPMVLLADAVLNGVVDYDAG